MTACAVVAEPEKKSKIISLSLVQRYAKCFTNSIGLEKSNTFDISNDLSKVAPFAVVPIHQRQRTIRSSIRAYFLFGEPYQVVIAFQFNIRKMAAILCG